MLSMERAFHSERTLRQMIGVSIEEFEALRPRFEEALALAGQDERHQCSGAGRKARLATNAEKLFFILFYLKCYRPFDVLGFLFEVHAAQACRSVKAWLPALERALEGRQVLPLRQLADEVEFEATFPRCQAVFVDGTERPIRRAKDYETQKANYSGKKRRHTKKNLVVSDERQRVLILTPPALGKAHDYALFKVASLGDSLPNNVVTWLDSGFEGVNKDYPKLTVFCSFKKPKGGKLSSLKKRFNPLVAKGQVLLSAPSQASSA
nr:transposase [Gammaproteobacteria bacterium]